MVLRRSNKMGDIKRKRKKFSRPKQLFDRVRIDEENVIVEKYGLKNKREIWKAKAKVSKFRKRAKVLIRASMEDQKDFFDKLNKLGFKIESISDVLALTETDLLERRLQTIVYSKSFSNTIKQARQLIVHKHIIVDGTIVNTPSFWVSKNLETKIEVKPKKEKPIKVEAQDEISEESNEVNE